MMGRIGRPECASSGFKTLMPHHTCHLTIEIMWSKTVRLLLLLLHKRECLRKRSANKQRSQKEHLGSQWWNWAAIMLRYNRTFLFDPFFINNLKFNIHFLKIMNIKIFWGNSKILCEMNPEWFRLSTKRILLLWMNQKFNKIYGSWAGKPDTNKQIKLLKNNLNEPSIISNSNSHTFPKQVLSFFWVMFALHVCIFLFIALFLCKLWINKIIRLQDTIRICLQSPSVCCNYVYDILDDFFTTVIFILPGMLYYFTDDDVCLLFYSCSSNKIQFAENRQRC